jgi:hypothetical protein
MAIRQNTSQQYTHLTSFPLLLAKVDGDGRDNIVGVFVSGISHSINFRFTSIALAN